MVIKREKRLNILMADDEIEMLRQLADRDGITSSDLIRVFVRRRYEEVFGSTKVKKGKK